MTTADDRPFAALDTITLLLRTAQLLADRQLSGADPAARMALAGRLRLARRAVADLQTPARPDRAGGPPAPGTGFTLPPTPRLRPFPERTEPFALGVGVPYDSLPPADVRPFRERLKS